MDPQPGSIFFGPLYCRPHHCLAVFPTKFDLYYRLSELKVIQEDIPSTLSNGKLLALFKHVLDQADLFSMKFCL